MLGGQESPYLNLDLPHTTCFANQPPPPPPLRMRLDLRFDSPPPIQDEIGPPPLRQGEIGFPFTYYKIDWFVLDITRDLYGFIHIRCGWVGC